MPGAAAGFTLGPDNVYFRRRLRRAHPETEDAMHEQRRDIVEVRTLQHASNALEPASPRQSVAHEAGSAEALGAVIIRVKASLLGLISL